MAQLEESTRVAVAAGCVVSWQKVGHHQAGLAKGCVPAVAGGDSLNAEPHGGLFQQDFGLALRAPIRRSGRGSIATGRLALLAVSLEVLEAVHQRGPVMGVGIAVLGDVSPPLAKRPKPPGVSRKAGQKPAAECLGPWPP